ncbi:MAG: metallophosphoesterase [Burkholderiales bacterium]|nr:metallophosphoesterase [Burkholderiales bacterium]
MLRSIPTGIQALLLAVLALLAAVAASASPAQPDVASDAVKDPRSLAAEYMARRAGRPPVLVGAGDIALCDHGQGAYAEATAKLLEAEPDALVFTTGDNTYQDGTWEQFANCYARSWGRQGIKARTLPAPGNHDYGSSRKPHEASAYFRYFGAAAANADTAGKGYYSLDLGSWHIVSLNSDIEMRLARDGALSPEARTALAAEVARQRAWLAADLAAARRRETKCILGIWHHPRYTNALRGDNDTMAGLWKLMSAAGADLLITGHEHIYENFAPRNAGGVPDPEGMREFVVGTGGAGGGYAFAAGAFHFGVLKLRLEPAGYAWEFLPVAGDNMRDQGSANCNRKRGA